MNAKWILVGILILALLALCAGIGAIAWFTLGPSGLRLGPIQAANFQAKATEAQSLSVSGPTTLDVTTPFGDIQITGAATQTISLTADKTAWGVSQAEAGEALKNLKVNVQQDGDQVTIRVEQLSNRPVMNNRGGSVDFTLQVPISTTVIAHSSSGRIDLKNTQGKTDLSSDFGDVTIDGVKGGVSARSNSGRITVRDLSLLDSGFGDVSMHSDFGKLVLENAQVQKASLTSKSGDVEVTGLRSDGAVELSSDFGAVRFQSGAASSLTIQVRSGAIELGDLTIGGPLTAHSDFGALTLNQVQAASYDLGSDSGGVTLDSATGKVLVRNGSGDITLRGGDETTLDLETKSGKIEYQGSLGAGPHRLKTDFGGIQLTLPKDSAFSFDLQTDFGKISSDFSVQINGEPNEKHWQGTVNGGGMDLTAETNSGSISLETGAQ